MNSSVWRRLITPVLNRIRTLLSRGALLRVDDGSGVQLCQVQLQADDVRANVERFQQYGFTSVPKAGAEAVTLSLGGSVDHTIIIAVDDRRYRLKNLGEGEVALYSDQAAIVLRQGNRIEISGTGGISLVGDVSITGSLQATGNISDLAGSMVAMRSVFNSHVHGSPGTPPAPLMS